MEEEFRRVARERPDLLVSALGDALTSNPEGLIAALMRRPDVLLRFAAIIAALPAVLPTLILRLLTPGLSIGTCGDIDAIRSRVSEVERRVAEVEDLVKKLLSNYGVGTQGP
ncbi:MAG: hypothetical protein RXP99_06640 [Vulcanisaeta sp.]|jgi:hypothetical protein